MDLNNMTLFSLMKGKLKWLSQRQEVLAQNVANSDTPGYKPSDLKAFSFKEMVKTPQNKINMTAADPLHLQGRRQRIGVAQEIQDARNYETSPDGNAVVLEEQMAKVAETQIEHKVITELYRKQLSMIKTALGKNR
ncbi:MAG: flagellar basal body rod protein FlgB [Rhodospirillaceae bacterium]|nr:flagellar basal body rod protein FlgB [Rhodospirillaceae bacterium]